MNNIISVEEIDKWLEKLEINIDNVETFNSKGEEMLTNINAYIADCKHFKEQEDLVRSFECMIHAFAIFETCLELNIFEIIEETK